MSPSSISTEGIPRGPAGEMVRVPLGDAPWTVAAPWMRLDLVPRSTDAACGSMLTTFQYTTSCETWYEHQHQAFVRLLQ